MTAMTATTVHDGTSACPSQAALVAAFAALVVLVGMNIVAIRFSNRELAPFWNAGLRFALAAILFAAIGVVRGAARPDRRTVADAIVYGLLAFAAFFGFLYVGLVRASAGLGQVILALGPLITLVMAVAIGLERLRWRPIAGGVVALAGIGLMYGVDAGGDIPPLSVLALVAAAASFAAGGIVAKRSGRADPVVRNTIATAVGAIVLLGLSALSGERWALPADPGTIIAVAYLVLPGTVGVFLLFLLLVRHWTATAVSTQFVLAPIIGISLGAILLAEPISPPIVAGAALVIGGVWLGAIRSG
jgi:drug/metabolite transporter (DMT)-like permease